MLNKLSIRLMNGCGKLLQDRFNIFAINLASINFIVLL